MFYIDSAKFSYFQVDRSSPFLRTKQRKWHLLTISRDTSDVKDVVEVTWAVPFLQFLLSPHTSRVENIEITQIVLAFSSPGDFFFPSDSRTHSPRSDCPASAATLVGSSDDVISFGWCGRHALILSYILPRFGASNSRITILYTLFQSDIVKCMFFCLVRITKYRNKPAGCVQTQNSHY
jgi:hypothetical protein